MSVRATVSNSREGRQGDHGMDFRDSDSVRQGQVQEVVKHVPLVHTMESIKQVPVSQVQTVENVVEVLQV